MSNDEGYMMGPLSHGLNLATALFDWQSAVVLVMTHKERGRDSKWANYFEPHLTPGARYRITIEKVG